MSTTLLDMRTLPTPSPRAGRPSARRREGRSRTPTKPRTGRQAGRKGSHAGAGCRASGAARPTGPARRRSTAPSATVDTRRSAWPSGWAPPARSSRSDPRSAGRNSASRRWAPRGGPASIALHPAPALPAEALELLGEEGVHARTRRTSTWVCPRCRSTPREGAAFSYSYEAGRWTCAWIRSKQLSARARSSTSGDEAPSGRAASARLSAMERHAGARSLGRSCAGGAAGRRSRRRWRLVETISGKRFPRPARFGGGSSGPSARFQALRIAVNDELGAARPRRWPLAWSLLREGGVLAGISFQLARGTVASSAFLVQAARRRVASARPEPAGMRLRTPKARGARCWRAARSFPSPEEVARKPRALPSARLCRARQEADRRSRAEGSDPACGRRRSSRPAAPPTGSERPRRRVSRPGASVDAGRAPAPPRARVAGDAGTRGSA